MGWLSALGSAIGEGAGAVGSAIGEGASAVGSGLGSAASAAGSGLGSAANTVGSGLSSAGSAIGSGISNVGNSIGNAFNSEPGESLVDTSNVGSSGDLKKPSGFSSTSEVPQNDKFDWMKVAQHIHGQPVKAEIPQYQPMQSPQGQQQETPQFQDLMNYLKGR